MHVLAASKALPAHEYSQEEVAEFLAALWTRGNGNDRRALRLEKFHRSVQVGRRRFALTKDEYLQLASFTDANAAFLRVGTDLAEEALTSALKSAGLDAQDLDAVFFTTVTGLAVPTIDAKLMNRLRLRRDVKRVPLFGLGCLAGAAGIARMHDYLLAFPEHKAALIAVELCSLTLQKNDISVSNIIASGLFGDGAAAVIGGGVGRPAKGRKETATTKNGKLKVTATRSSFYYDTERVMGWDIGANGFKIVLDSSVPDMVRNHLADDLLSFLAAEKLKLQDIKTWICHTGGPKVLEAMEKTFDLDASALALSWESLRNHGNLSSASVLLVLAETLERAPKQPGEKAIMLAMGPGFCSEIVLLEWN